MPWVRPAYAPWLFAGISALSLLLVASSGAQLLSARRAWQLSRIALWAALGLGLLGIALLLLGATLLGKFDISSQAGRLVMAALVAVLAGWVVCPLLVLRWLDGSEPRPAARHFRRGLQVVAVSSVLLAALTISFVAWRSPAARSGSPERYVVGEWSRGARVAQRVVSSSEQGLQAENAEGHAFVIEKIVAEGPVIRQSELLFALSFRPGADGVRASCHGRDAYLTPEDLRANGAYRSWALGWLVLGPRLDRERVLGLAARELPCSAAELLQQGSLRRTVNVRIPPVSAPDAPPSPPVDAPLTSADLTARLQAATSFLENALDENGRLQPSAPVPSANDWVLEAHAVTLLAHSARVLELPPLRAAARRGIFDLHEHRSSCGDGECLGQGRVVSIAASAAALEANVTLARTVMAQVFLRDIHGLSTFLRAVQLPSGAFPADHDREAQLPAAGVGDPSATAEALRALSAAYELERDPRDLEAIRRAIGALTRSQPFDPLGVHSQQRADECIALLHAARAGVDGGLHDCTAWSLGRRAAQVSGAPSDPFSGGIRPSAFALPTTSSSSSTAQALLDAARIMLRDPKHDDKAVGTLLDTAASALTFVAQQALPGERADVQSDVNVARGAWSDGPLANGGGVAAVEQAAAALLDYVSLLRERDPYKVKKKAPPPFSAQASPAALNVPAQRPPAEGTQQPR